MLAEDEADNKKHNENEINSDSISYGEHMKKTSYYAVISTLILGSTQAFAMDATGCAASGGHPQFDDCGDYSGCKYGIVPSSSSPYYQEYLKSLNQPAPNSVCKKGGK